MDYQEIIKNKTVALVGPAAYMVGSSLGEEIDKHDMVVRINRGIELISDYHHDIGERTDILYSCLLEAAENAGKQSPESLKEDYKISAICTVPHSDMKGIATKTELHYMVNKKNVDKISELIPVRIIDHQFFTGVSRKINCRPNTGFIAIFDLLRFEPEQLSVYGFSFYLDGFIPKYKSGIAMTEDEFAKKCLNSKRHVQKNMWSYCKQTLRDNSRVRLDPYLGEILNLENFNKEDYQRNEIRY